MSVYALAARIWAELPGSYADRCTALAELLTALKDIQRAKRPPTTTRGNPDLEATLTSVIGKKLSQVETVHVPLEGVMVNLTTIFRAAQEPAHPFARASAAFLAQHGLELQVTQTGNRPRVRIGRREVAGAAELAKLRATLAKRPARSNPNAGGWSTPIATTTPTMTDHSGGIVTTVPVERGDD